MKCSPKKLFAKFSLVVAQSQKYLAPNANQIH